MLHIQPYSLVVILRGVSTSGTYGTLGNPQPRLAPTHPLYWRKLFIYTFATGQVPPDRDQERHLARLTHPGVFQGQQHGRYPL